MKKIIITFFVVFFYYQCSFAIGVAIVEKTVFRVKLKDIDLILNKIPVINVQVSAYPFGGAEYFDSKDFAYEQVATNEGNVFTVSSPADVFYMYIYYEGGGVSTGLCYGVDNIYIIKAGSELTIELDNNSINFSGKGAIIPNIQSQIVKYGYKLKASDIKLINNKEYLKYFQKLDKSRDSALQLQLGVIESNKAILGDYYVKVLTANCYGYRYYSQLSGYNFFLREYEAFFKAFKKYYNEKIKVRIMPEFSNEVLDASPIFANYLVEELNILERIRHEEYGPMLPDSCIRNILQKINTNFNGALRDKLLTIFTLRTKKNENALPFFDGILQTVKTKRYHDLLVNKIKVKENNLPFRNFNLADETGKSYSLNSFKNKVVVLDFWFTGCENCAILNKAMKPIIKHFSNNPQIQFISVSIDKSKEQWLKSVQLGNYTHHDGINLYTNGEGANHDLIRHYNITGYPTVFVIKDGMMFSSLPPRPSGLVPSGQEFSANGVRLIEMLEKALAEMKLTEKK